MNSVNTKLRDLRTSASPKLSVRAMASALDMPLGTYSAYESSRYKKPLLPLDFARRVASVLAQYKVDPTEVMKLAGLKGGEAEPEAREIESQRPAIQFVSFPVALPSEIALRDMFESLLTLVPDGASRAETAQILARRLPSGFAGIGPFTIDQGFAAPTIGDVTQSFSGKGPAEKR